MQSRALRLEEPHRLQAHDSERQALRDQGGQGLSPRLRDFAGQRQRAIQEHQSRGRRGRRRVARARRVGAIRGSRRRHGPPAHGRAEAAGRCRGRIARWAGVFLQPQDAARPERRERRTRAAILRRVERALAGRQPPHAYERDPGRRDALQRRRLVASREPIRQAAAPPYPRDWNPCACPSRAAAGRWLSRNPPVLRRTLRRRRSRSCARAPAGYCRIRGLS